MLKVRISSAAGVPQKDLKESVAGAWNTLLAGAAAGKSGFGWMNLPDADISDLKKMGEELAAYRYIILIGIGGSALGMQMLMNAFLDPAYPHAGGEKPALFVADNADGETNEAIWKQVDPKKTAILVVSKSGRTLETLSNFLYFREMLYKTVGAAAEKQIFAVTDPVKGFLRRYAGVYGTRCVDLPEDTGGRYSVLSSCGIVSAAALGIDVDKLLAGAKAMKKNLLNSTEYGLASTIATEVMRCGEAGRTVTVFWSYGDRLKSVSEWFAQLWGESLGKEGKGMTPQAALGSIDQHSQLQLYTSGPQDKFFFFLSSKPDTSLKLSIPEGELFDEARYLEGVSPATILEYERTGVAASLKRRGLPLCEIQLDKIDEYCIGGLIFLLEAVTALVGFMLEVDPFDQPGVEEGKNYALALCGSSAYEKYLAVLDEINANAKGTDFCIE